MTNEVTFSDERPTEPGAYYWRQNHHSITCVREIHVNDLLLLPENSHRLHGQWRKLIPSTTLAEAKKRIEYLEDYIRSIGQAISQAKS